MSSAAAPALARETKELAKTDTLLAVPIMPKEHLAVATPEEEEEDPEEKRRRTEVLAYQLWQERGCPIGSDHIDWHQAELRIHAESITQGS